MPAKDRDIQSFLPLTPAMLHTLLALADGDKHGYAILKEVSRRTAGKVRLGPGTLYTLIKRALADGLIVETDDRPDPCALPQRGWQELRSRRSPPCLPRERLRRDEGDVRLDRRQGRPRSGSHLRGEAR